MIGNTVLSRSIIIDDLAEVLGVLPERIDDGDNVADLGLDSVRLMVLVEKWRAMGAKDADLISLSSNPRVGSWVSLLTTRSSSITPPNAG